MRVGEVVGCLGRLVRWVVEWCGGVVVVLWSGGSALVGDSVGVLVGILVGVLHVRCLVCGSRCFSCCFDRMIWSVTCLDFLSACINRPRTAANNPKSLPESIL